MTRPFNVELGRYPIEIHASNDKGRYAVATRDIRRGEVLFEANFYAASIFDSHRKRACAACVFYSRKSILPLRCRGCDQVYYCSIECARSAGVTTGIESEEEAPTTIGNHSTVCTSLRRLATTGKLDRHQKSVVKLVLLILARRAVDPSSYHAVESLQSHYEDWSEESKRDWERLRGFLEGMLIDIEWESFLNLVSKVESNGFGVYAYRKNEEKLTCFGRAVFPSASYFNHSCRCNCEFRQAQGDEEDDDDDGKEKDGEKGEEEEGAEKEREEIEKMEEAHEKEKGESDISSLPHGDNNLSQPSSDAKLIEDTNNEDLPPPTPPSPPLLPRGRSCQMTLIALTDIPCHAELTIGYIDQAEEKPLAARRSQLLAEYYFLCRCDACLAEEAAPRRPTIKWGAKGGGKAKKQGKRKAKRE
ncbi:uncharacterized protein VTP21DRAFT_1393 [Calcarisporiella thermophila]|uniref:uncharacterized protein n=1 Tax=Calcarisporiella thermophila TaxID=911321 RepID=UPI00374311E0